MDIQVCLGTLLVWVFMTDCIGVEVEGLSPTCSDMLPNCNDYSQKECEGKYRPWAIKNCRRFCNLCDEDPREEQAECKDYHTHCAYNYHTTKKQMCKDGVDGNMYALSNCRKYCGLCDPTKKFNGSKPNKKSCQYNKSTYEHQMTWLDTIGCNSCHCNDGGWGCLNLICLPLKRQDCYKIPKRFKDDCCNRYLCSDGSIHFSY